MKKKLYILTAIAGVILAIAIFVPREIKLVSMDETEVIKMSIFDEVTLQSKEDEHYEFLGWKLDDKFIDSIVHPMFFMEVHAEWEPKSYTVEFKDYEHEPMTYQYGSELDLPNVEVAHYNFIGWKDVETDQQISKIEKGFDKNYALSPILEPKTYAITYQLDGGTLNNPINSYVYGTKPSLPKPTKDGYVFAGWVSSTDFEFNKDLVLTATWEKPYWVARSMSDVYAGDYIQVGNYSASLSSDFSQATIDASGTAGSAYIDGKFIIGDHQDQGFSTIASFPVGGTAMMKRGGQERELTLVSRYSGTNSGDALTLDDGRSFGSVSDGSIVMYTCQRGGGGTKVWITYWN